MKVWEAPKARSGSRGFRRRFNRVPGEGAGEGLGVFGAEPGHVQQGSGEGSGQGLGGFGADPALGFAARFRKICKIKRCGCRGYHRSLFLEILVSECHQKRNKILHLV